MFPRIFISTFLASVALFGQDSGPKKTASLGKLAPSDAEREIKLGVDEPGCKDSALLARIPGCTIIQCDSKPDAENVKVIAGAATDGTTTEEFLDGDAEIIYYLCPTKTTVLSIAKQSESALTKGGYKVLFNGRDNDDFPMVTARREDQWIQISTYIYNDLSAYIQTAIKADPEEPNTADAFLDEFVKSGKVVLSGLTFEADKLNGESDKVLTELAMFLVRQPDLKVRIEAHVDEQADKTAAVETSKKRASAVAVWLLEHGVEANRVSIQGFGDTRPVTDNTNEQNRAKNRRIELVKM
jgi:OmpA-OmpF porin, OOP family